MVVWSGWSCKVPFPCWYLYSILQASPWKVFQTTGTPCLQFWPHSWLGYKASTVWAVYLWWPASIMWVLFRRDWTRWSKWQPEAWMLDRLQGRWIYCDRLRTCYWGQIFHETDWLHTFQRWALCRFCIYYPQWSERPQKKRDFEVANATGMLLNIFSDPRSFYLGIFFLSYCLYFWRHLMF